MLAIGPLTGLALFIFRFCTGNHPSVTFGDSSPQRGATANIRLDIGSPRGELDAERPEGWFLATNLTPVGWFLAANLTPVGWFLATNLTAVGWFLAANLTPVGWFHTQGLKINRTTAMYTQKNLFPNNPP